MFKQHHELIFKATVCITIVNNSTIYISLSISILQLVHIWLDVKNLFYGTKIVLIPKIKGGIRPNITS